MPVKSSPELQTQNKAPLAPNGVSPEVPRTASAGSPRVDRLKGFNITGEHGVTTLRREESTNSNSSSKKHLPSGPMRDPWDAQLVPIEPNPADFDTFEAFEIAMRRWAYLVSQIEVIPIHALQLPSVIPLTLPTLQQQVKTSDQIVGAELSAPRRPGLPYVDFWDPLGSNKDFQASKLAKPEPKPFLPDLDMDDDDDVQDFLDIMSSSVTDISSMIPPGALLSGRAVASALPDLNDFGMDSFSASESFRLRVSVGTASESHSATPISPLSMTGYIPPEEVIADVSNGLDAIYTRSTQNHEKYPPYHNAPVLGELRGTFSKPEWAGHRSGLLQLRTDALRRTDLTPLQIEKSHSCSAIVDGRPVEFHMPAFDLAGISYRELVQSSSYRQEVAQRVLQLQSHTRHFPCYSWYRKTPSASVQSETSKLIKLATTRGKETTIEEISQILLGPMDLDVFQDVLGEDIELPNGGTKTIGSILAQSIQVKQFPLLLDLFERTQEALAHSKISAFVTNVLQFNKAHELVQYLVSNGNLEHIEESTKFAHLHSNASDILSSPRLFMGTLRTKRELNGLKYLPLLCYALSYFRPVKTDLYPYSPELVSLATGVLGSEYRPIMELILVYYYVKTIQSILHSQSLQFGTAAPMVNRTLNMVSTSLLGQLIAYPAFLGSMISSIGYRSVKVSSLFTFMTLQLLHCDSFGPRAVGGPLPSGGSPSNSSTNNTPRRLTSKGSSETLTGGQNSLQPTLEIAEEIKTILATKSVDLLGITLKTLSSSKFSHVRHACQRIVAVLCSPAWMSTSLDLFETSMNLPTGPFADFTSPDETISPHYLEALGTILGAGIQRAIDSADHLISNPSHATVLVSSPAPSAVRESFRSGSAPPSTSTSTMSTYTYPGATSSSVHSGTANNFSTMSNPGVPSSSSSGPIAASSSAQSSPSRSTVSGNAAESGNGTQVSMLRLPSTNSVASNSSLPSSPSSAASSSGSNSPSSTQTTSRGQITYADLVNNNAAAISFLLSNRTIYALLKICGDTLTNVDYRTHFAASLLAKLGKAFTRFRSLQLAPSIWSNVSGANSRRATTLIPQLPPPILDSVPLLSYMRDFTQFPHTERIVRIGLHELKGIFEFLSFASGAVPRIVHDSKTNLLKCLRHILKSSPIYEAVKQESDMHTTLASLCRSPPFSTNTEAWRCLYQMIKFHPGTVEYLVKNKFLNMYFEGLGSYGSSDKWQGLIMTQNALKYTTKLFSLNTDPAYLHKQKSNSSIEKTSSGGSLAGSNSPAAGIASSVGAHQANSAQPTSAGGAERAGANSSAGSGSSATSTASSSNNSSISALVAPMSPSKHHQSPDAKALSQFIINSHVFIKFHVIYKRLSELDSGAAYAELISFYYVLLTHPNCKKLLKATSKHDSFREGIAFVTQLSPLIKEMVKQDKIWSGARAALTKERIRVFKMREKDDAMLGIQKSKKDKEKEKEKEKKDSRDKEADKDKDKKKKKVEKDKKRALKSPTSSSSSSPGTRVTTFSSSTTVINGNGIQVVSAASAPRDASSNSTTGSSSDVEDSRADTAASYTS